MKVYRDVAGTDGKVVKTPIFNIMEGTYNGQDMGERSITATIEFPTMIDFRAGDYVEFDIADLIRGENVEGGHYIERFFIYTMPTVKKIASSMSVGNAFEHTVTFYPRQYELGCTQMRDLLQGTNSNIIYTGYDEFSFFGGAKTLMDRIMAVLRERFGSEGVAGKDYWDYRISESVNEEINTALEKFQFDFSGTSVMEALVKLNDQDGINTKFWINERMIYVGFKRPYICGVDNNNILRTIPFEFRYGKTSHMPIGTNYGNLFSITKSLGSSSPITRLYAYGADRNLHRFYCADRIKSGRYVNHLMLPSFGNDGKTDYIDSAEGIERFGIREGSKTFDDIYPSLRYFTYGDLRSIKYCIKLMGSGYESDDQNMSDMKGTFTYPIARVQCYKVVEVEGTGVNRLVESLPPTELAVYVHATGKVVKVVLRTSMEAQLAADGSVPMRNNGSQQIPGAAFAVHDPGFECHSHTHDKYLGAVGSKYQSDAGEPLTRRDWFVNADNIKTAGSDNKTDPAKEKYKNEVSIHQIHYTDTAWITDIYEFTSYDQTAFSRQGYSAYCYPRINNRYPESLSDSTEVNQIVHIPNVAIEDTDLNVSDGTAQPYFEVFLRDFGFKINEQSWFGDYVFLMGTCKVSFLDGNLGGYEFEIPQESEQHKLSEIFVPALLEDGSQNPRFFEADDYVSAEDAYTAYEKGAFWRVLLIRAETEVSNYWMPNININGSAGDRFVLLDLYMPDVYQRVAERRLEREARKYLDANDDGDIQYSFEFDKVRLLQIPSFGLQLREGAIMRVVDDDLDVKTLTGNKTLVNYPSPLVSNQTTKRSEVDEVVEEKSYEYETTHRDFSYIKTEIFPGIHTDGIEKYMLEAQQINSLTEQGGVTFTLKVTLSDEDVAKLKGGNGYTLYFPDNKVKCRLCNRIFGVYGGYTVYMVDETKPAEYLSFHVEKIEEVEGESNERILTCSWLGMHNLPSQRIYVVFPEYSILRTTESTELHATHKNYILPQGTRFFCPSQELVSFSASKYYEVTMDVEDTTMPYFDTNGNRTLFALLNNLGEGSKWFVPLYTAEEITSADKGWRRFKFKFTLDETFNDSQDYYPAIQYISDGETETVSVRLVSIIESDDEALKDLKYADLTIDTISVRFNDNTRESGVSLQNGLEPTRRATNVPGTMIREITATVKEESRASTWTQMMDNIKENEIMGEQITKTQEALANSARRRYRELLALRDSIFDPDGTVDQTFLQVMMLQVGADSMNYQLDKTRTLIAEAQTQDFENGYIWSNGGVSYFHINSEDVLRHFVFTEDEPGGTWYVDKPEDFPLSADSDGNFPTYFVAIKCPVHSSTGAQWVCEPTQHKVNEDPNYYYFNWGILFHQGDGAYTIMETRGNAYMYGDNLVCGRISTLAGQSYFDLTHGDFVLSDGTTTALSYIDGVLTISGIEDERVDDVLERLGLVEQSINEEIGGENLLANIGEVETISTGALLRRIMLQLETVVEGKKTTTFPAGKYVFSVEDFAYRTTVYPLDFQITDGIPDAVGNTSYGTITKSAKVITFTLEKESVLYIYSSVTNNSLILTRAMLQRGEKKTTYQPYVEHLTSALKGSTEIAGGLTLTNLLLLKNESGKVTAGMSGLQGTTDNPENVLLWGGGTYEDALKQANGLAAELAALLPILITKSGAGSKIGCFNVVNDHSISVTGSDGSQIIIDSGGDSGSPSISVIKNGETVTEITSKEISKKTINLVRLSSITFDPNDSSSRVQISRFDMVVSRVDVSKVGLTVGTKYGLTMNATTAFIRLILFNPVGGSYPNMQNFKLRFDLYLGNTRLCSVDEAKLSQGIGSSGQAVIATASLVTETRTMSISSTDDDYLNVRNITVTGEYGGNSYDIYAAIYEISFGIGDTSNYTVGSLDLLESDGVTRTTIGSNGMIVKGDRGGFMQILNSEQRTYFRVAGLPIRQMLSGSEQQSGQVFVYNTDSGMANFRDAFNKFRSLVNGKDGVSVAGEAAVAAIPDLGSLLGITE